MSYRGEANILRQGNSKRGSGAELGPEDRSRLIALIEEATVDAHDAGEQALGFYTMISECLALPFKTTELGRAVSVTEIELAEDDGIFAVCIAGGEQQRIGLLDRPLPANRPTGAEWINAYRLWRGDAGPS